MISEQVILALIVAVPAVIASAVVPTVILMLNNSAARKIKEVDAAIRKQEKLDDYARADAIEARRTAEAHQLLVRQDTLARKADEAASILKTNTAAVVRTSGETQGQLQQIHTLVNSNLTAEMKARLVSMEAGLASLLEIVELRRTLGHPESEGAATLINQTRTAIDELKSTLEERLKATDAAALEKASSEKATLMSDAVERSAADKATITAAAAVAATTAIAQAGPLRVTIQQDAGDPVPVVQTAKGNPNE